MFCLPAFHDLNGVPDRARRRFDHRVQDRWVGTVDGVVQDDGVLLSGHRAPFGGPDVAEDLTAHDALGLVGAVLEAARSEGLRRVRVRARPAVYSGAEPVLEYAMLHLGFRVEHCDLNQHVDLATAADPLALLKDRKRRYVRSALARPHELVDVDGGADLGVLHDLLAANRRAHGRPPPLSEQYLAAARAAFPDRVRFVLLRQDGVPTAGAVVYRVLDDVDQVVHWADAGGLPPSRAAMELLAHLVTADARRRGARLLDLGPSTEKDGSLNLGLAAFKRSVGATAGTRKVLVHDLHAPALRRGPR